MIRALLIVRDDPRDFGVWQLAALPVEGHVMVIGVNDRPTYFRVVNVFHVPVPAALADQGAPSLPYVAIGLAPYLPPDAAPQAGGGDQLPDAQGGQWRE